MLTIITPLKCFRVSRSIVEGTFQCMTPESSTVSGPYAEVIELLAALKREVYTPHIVEMALTNIGIGKRTLKLKRVSFDIVCSNGTVTYHYAKETLVRHSLLIKGFIEDHPDATSIDMRNHTTHSVNRVLKTILEEGRCCLTREDLYTLQTLTPPTDLYYLLFPLWNGEVEGDFIVSLLKGMTEDERQDVLRVHQLSHEIEWSKLYRGEDVDADLRELPAAGRGLAIGYAFNVIREYLRERPIPELTDPFPSYTFYEIVDYGHYDERNSETLLLTADFSDDSGLLHDEGSETFLMEEILGHTAVVTWPQACILLAMLGIKDPLLKNEKVERYAPYQITAKKGSILPHIWKGDNGTRARIERIAEIPMEEVDRIMAPYLAPPRE